MALKPHQSRLSLRERTPFRGAKGDIARPLAPLALLMLAMAPALARADGGTVRVSQRCGDRRVTVFTDPTPLRAGPVDVSVLIQDAATGEPLLDHAIGVEVAPSDLSLAPARYRASHAAATNKLLQAAQFDLPHAGRWTFTVIVQARQETVPTRFELDVGDAPPAWQSLWPWFTWPVLAIASFVAFHRW